MSGRRFGSGGGWLAIPALLMVMAGPAAAAAAAVAYHYEPAEAEAVFVAANEACLREEYKSCVEGYERLLSAGWLSADLFYNLGTASLRQGRVGPAILHLERALRLDPDDADARANLEAAHRMRVDKLLGSAEESGGAEAPLHERIAAHTRGQRWSLAFLLTWTLGGLLLVARRLLARPAVRLAALLAGIAAMAASAPCAAVTAAHLVREAESDEAIVVANVAAVREGPRENLKTSFEVHEGLKVRVLDREAGFVRIRLANGLQGWLPADSLALVAF